MNLLKILGKVGASVLADVIPGGNTILNVVNGFLSDDDKLPTNATGAQIQDAISTMPVNLQAELMTKEFDVEITEIKEHTNVIKALGEVDSTGNSTRPEIAKMMATIVSFAVIVLVSVLAVAVYSSDKDTIKSIGEAWPLVVAILGTPTALLRMYFGLRTKEKQQKYQAVSNTQPSSNIVELIKSWKSK